MAKSSLGDTSGIEDMELARIYGGMHFRTAGEEGTRQGRKIGKWVLENFLLPLD